MVVPSTALHTKKSLIYAKKKKGNKQKESIH